MCFTIRLLILVCLFVELLTKSNTQCLSLLTMAAAQFTDPGLERLMQLATIKVHQTSSGFNGNNYTILGGEEEVLFTLDEDVPDSFFRNRGARRPFKFDGVDNTGRKMFSFHRATGGILMADKVELFINGGLVSIIHKENTFTTAIFSIHDAQDTPTIRLKGRRTSFFELQTNTKTVIGSLEKKSRGWRTEFFSYNDDYIITFPVDLAVQFKLAVIVASVHIDFKFHERASDGALPHHLF